ncbi:MAG: histidine--tRNA ligase [Bacteroidia bacterium]|nr:histidine--tRNA ligase [Bacteroidia bacterium]
MSQKPSIPAGTRDFSPEVMIRREYLFETLRKVFRKYGYAPLETPAMENLAVLTGKYGEEGDRLIFKILNSGDFLKGLSDFSDSKKLSFQISDRALRYDLTVPFARFVVMNQNEITFPFKRYQIQPVWRADRPQKGRYREFYQCDADVVGSDSLLFEAEFICIYDEALTRLGFEDFTIMINNRKILTGYAEVIAQEEKFMDICIAIDKLDKIGEEGVKKELAERGISPEDAARLFEIITFEGEAEEKLNFLEKAFAGCKEGLQGVAEIREVLDTYRHFSRFAGKVELNLKLARGLNYYTGTVYEVKVNNFAMGSIGGGGRYADLTGVFGKPGLSGIGISFGADRIYDVMEGLNLFGQIAVTAVKVLIINFGGETLAPALKTLNQLRQAGFAAEFYPENTKLGKQFAYADKKAIPYTLIIGTEEVKSGKYKLKNMKTGEQEEMTLEQVFERLAGE